VRARGLLASTPCSIDEIAAMTGYESLPSFITLFRSRTGLTPTQYRRERRGEFSNRR
jgi:transcriptional regulator GlxA family with amidase domain